MSETQGADASFFDMMYPTVYPTKMPSEPILTGGSAADCLAAQAPDKVGSPCQCCSGRGVVRAFDYGTLMSKQSSCPKCGGTGIDIEVVSENMAAGGVGRDVRGATPLYTAMNSAKSEDMMADYIGAEKSGIPNMTIAHSVGGDRYALVGFGDVHEWVMRNDVAWKKVNVESPRLGMQEIDVLRMLAVALLREKHGDL